MMRRSTSSRIAKSEGEVSGAFGSPGSDGQKFVELQADAANNLASADGFGQKIGSMILAVREDDGAFDGVFEFADVAGPVVIDEELHRGVGEIARRLGVVRAVLLEEALDEQRDIFFALAQRRQVEGDDVEAMEQIFAEAAFADEFAQIFVGGGEDADVDFDGFGAAEAHELALLDHAQKLGLGFGADGGNFVEENRALIGDFEEAFFRCDGAGEGAFHVAEKLRFEKVDRNRAGVDGDEGFVGARGGGVNGFGDDFFSGAAFAADEGRWSATARPA